MCEAWSQALQNQINSGSKRDWEILIYLQEGFWWIMTWAIPLLPFWKKREHKIVRSLHLGRNNITFMGLGFKIAGLGLTRYQKLGLELLLYYIRKQGWKMVNCQNSSINFICSLNKMS
jgi:hypothetical protein